MIKLKQEADLYRLSVTPPNSSETTFQVIATRYVLGSIWPSLCAHFQWVTTRRNPLESYLDNQSWPDVFTVGVGTKQQIKNDWIGQLVVERVEQ